MEQQPQLNIDLKNTSSVKCENGSPIFSQGVIMRKVSKFLIGSDVDSLLPIPVFYDPETGKILSDSIPEEIREEYKDYLL